MNGLGKLISLTFLIFFAVNVFAAYDTNVYFLPSQTASDINVLYTFNVKNNASSGTSTIHDVVLDVADINSPLVGYIVYPSTIVSPTGWSYNITMWDAAGNPSKIEWSSHPSDGIAPGEDKNFYFVAHTPSGISSYMWKVRAQASSGSTSYAFEGSSTTGPTYAKLVDVSITPNSVLVGDNTSFSVTVRNIGGSGVTVNTASMILFASEAYTATLASPVFVDANSTGVLVFNSAIIPSVPKGTYVPTLNLYGKDLNSTNDYAQSILATNSVIGVGNTAPVANDKNISTNEDTAVSSSFDVSDVDADALTCSVNLAPANGSVLINSCSDFSYTPNTNFNGSDSFIFNVSDGVATSSGTINITVVSVDDAPVASDATITTSEDTKGTTSLSVSDVDSVVLTCAIVASASNGTAVVNSDCTAEYTPNAGYFGSDSFTYNANDGASNSNTATVSVTVSSVNDDPVAVDDSASTIQGIKVLIPVLENDYDSDGNILIIESVSSPANGVALVDGNQIQYTSNPAYVGGDSFTYTISDGIGGSATATVTVTVSADTNAPSITAPADIIQEAEGVLTLVAIGLPIVLDDSDPAPIVSNNAPDGNLFPVGVTFVTWSATDYAGNISTAIQQVTVQDTTAPDINAPLDINVEATGTTTAVVLGTPSVFDIVDSNVVITNDAPAEFSVGVTLVTWTATDHYANSRTAVQNVIVSDTTAPVISGVPADIIAEATALTGNIIEFTNPSATDLVDGSVKVTCSPASGSGFELGTTIVTCSGTDNSNNTGSASFNVTVVDTTPPVIYTLGNIFAQATSLAGANVFFDVNAVDLVDGNLVAVCTPATGSFFGFNTTTNVVCDVNDAAGNNAKTDFNVTVVDTIAPVMIDLNASVSSRTVTLTFSASDENSTGVRGYYVSSDQNTWTYTTDTNAQFVGLANGTYTFFVKATDFADNNSVDLNVTAIVNVQEGGGDNGGGGGSGGGGGGSGGGTTVAGPPIVVETNTAGPENDEEVNTGSTTEDTLEVTDVPQETTLPPATGAFTAGNNSPNSFWIWFLLLIPAAMWVYAAKRIREQRLAATPTKKKK